MHTNKVVILEGPDGAGKTTLAKVFEERFGYRYHHEGPPPAEKNLLNYYGALLYDACHADQPVVFDRLHVGEAVYGPLLRSNNRFGLDSIKLINRIRSAYAVYTIFCMPPYDVAHTNWKYRKGELFHNDTLFNKVFEAYDKLIQNPLLAYAGVWDYTKGPPALSTAEMADRILRGYTISDPLPRGIIGSPQATFLFVGDVANQEVLDLPFFATTNSSKFLNDSLEEAGYTEYEIALANAYTLSGNHYEFRGVVDRFKQVIALGNRAQDALTAQGIKSQPAAHPAYWRRFHSRFSKNYVDRLETIREDFYALSDGEVS